MAERKGPRRGRLCGLVALAGASALALACATPGAEGGPEAPVRLEGPAAVGWEPDGPFALPLGIHNASGYTLSLARPLPEALEVKLFRASDGSLACQTPSPTRRQYEGRELRPVRASSDVPLIVDLGPYCRHLAPGVYDYRAVFVANPAEGGAGMAFAGTLGPRSGRIAVGPGLSRDAAALAAALSSAPGEPARARPPAGP